MGFVESRFKMEFDKLSDALFSGDDRHKYYSREQWDEERGEPHGRGASSTR
jgi:hypothetical protein